MATSSWLRLAGRVAVVTGAGSGIGATVSYALASQGCHVILADTDLEKAKAVAKICSSQQKKHHESLKQQQQQQAGAAKHETSTTSDAVAHHELSLHPRSVAVQCDVCKTEEVERMIKTADEVAESVLQDDYGSNPDTLFVDVPLASILINSAGITRDSLIQNMSEEEFDNVLDVNLRGTFLTCKHFASKSRLEMLATSPFASSIVNISSLVGSRGNIGQANYAASKAGVYGLTKSLAKELAQYNVRANAVMPGFIDTPMSAKVPEHIRNRMISNIPMKRFGTTENVSDLILFLASERSAYITGEGVVISGAMTF